MTITINSSNDVTPAYVLGEVLRRLGVVEDLDSWEYTVGYLPEKPSTSKKKDSLAFFDSTPIILGKGMKSRQTLWKPGVQIRVRARSYEVAYAKAIEVMTISDTVYRQKIEVETDWYLLHSIRHTSGILNLGKDEVQRSNLSLNVILSMSIYGD